MNNRILIIVALFIIFITGVWYLTSANPGTIPLPTDEQGGSAPTTTPLVSAVPQFREFVIEGKNYSFMPAEIRVKKGDTVRVTFTNKGGLHNWRLDEFNVGTKQIQDGQSETVEFVANQTGTFEYYCSVGNHRQMGMVGKLIVE